MGYGVGMGASDKQGEYGNSPREDAILAVANGLKNGDIAKELKNSPYNRRLQDDLAEYLQDAVLAAAKANKGDKQKLEILAAANVVSRAELGLPENKVTGAESQDVNPKSKNLGI